MSKAAGFKKKGAEHEAKRQYDRAVALYTQAIEAAAGIPDELDIPLHNRVGDLYLRLGNTDMAATYFERAADLYADGGFFNNAIALCNKILRHSPGRSVIYYKLGKISARKGFISDAKQYFLQYAEQMERSGDSNEGFRALAEFADLCPGQDEVRVTLADHLLRAGRSAEAVAQLQQAYDSFVADKKSAEASDVLGKIRSVEPGFEPGAARAEPSRKREGLFFIDVDYAPAEGESAPESAAEMPAQDPPPYNHQDFAAASSMTPLDVDRSNSDVEDAPEPWAESVPAPPPLDPYVADEVSPLAGLNAADDPMDALESHPPASLSDNTEANNTAATFDIVSPFDATGFEAAMPSSLDQAPTVETPRDESFFTEDVPVFGESAADFAASLGALVDPPHDPDLEDALPTSPDGMIAAGLQPLDAPDDIDTAAGLDSAPADETEGEGDADEFVDLREWLKSEQPPANPRMTAGDEASTTDEPVQSDFSKMLDTFRAGVAANVDASDSASHYDLGVAYLEMGLLDDAVAQFQSVVREGSTAEERVRAYEMLGECFLRRDEYDTAIEAMRGALSESGVQEAKLIGVLYLHGRAYEAMERWRDAEDRYRRVFALDVGFRDVAVRLKNAASHA